MTDLNGVTSRASAAWKAPAQAELALPAPGLPESICSLSQRLSDERGTKLSWPFGFMEPAKPPAYLIFEDLRPGRRSDRVALKRSSHRQRSGSPR
jgi:hypothetical protein